jgi:hypothetical protein
MPAATDDVLAAVDRLTVLAHHHDALGDLAVLTGALAAAMPPDCIIGPAEVRALAGGVTHRTFKLWREGQNLAGRGPGAWRALQAVTVAVHDGMARAA